MVTGCSYLGFGYYSVDYYGLLLCLRRIQLVLQSDHGVVVLAHDVDGVIVNAHYPHGSFRWTLALYHSRPCCHVVYRSRHNACFGRKRGWTLAQPL